MNVLILGGTGAMGSHVSELLNSKGYNIFITSRSARENRGALRICKEMQKNFPL